MSERRKLIEVALPLDAINRESAREKSIRHGHPSTLHLWWARRPLAACRAVLFASIVDDPSSCPEEFPSEQDQERERQRLFRLIEELVKWENSNNEAVLGAAREEIRKATAGNPPPVLDPFCGGGSIPLEAQRLGLEAHASDLNPVAVLITKALVEIPPMYAGRPPVNPAARAKIGGDTAWNGAQGLAEDIRYYGQWIRDVAFQRIGHLYPPAKLPEGREATVIAWLWTPTVRCPNPACGAEMPLVRSFVLSTRKGKEWHVEPLVEGKSRPVAFRVNAGKTAANSTVDRGGARCSVCGQVAPLEYVRTAANQPGLGRRLMAVVGEGKRVRWYLDASQRDLQAATQASPEWGPEELVTTPSHDVDRLPMYGMKRWRDAFTPRQLLALTTFTQLIGQARERVLTDGGSDGYGDALATYLAFAVSRMADYSSTLATWSNSGEFIRGTFGRQALPMTWDFAECNPFSASTGNWTGACQWIAKVLESLPAAGHALVQQLDATHTIRVDNTLVCTDPPYYDNVGYADLSDYFYVWLRRSLRDIYPDLFSTLLAPKREELVATPHRFNGSRDAAEEFFENGLKRTFARMRESQHPAFPLTLFYAFKQAESQDGAIASTGWDTMLTGLVESGFSVTGTWPIRSVLGDVKHHHSSGISRRRPRSSGSHRRDLRHRRSERSG